MDIMTIRTKSSNLLMSKNGGTGFKRIVILLSYIEHILYFIRRLPYEIQPSTKHVCVEYTTLTCLHSYESSY